MRGTQACGLVITNIADERVGRVGNPTHRQPKEGRELHRACVKQIVA